MNIKQSFFLLIIILSVGLCVPTKAQIPFQKKGKWGLTDTTGKVILKSKYDTIYPFQRDYAIVEEKGKKGVVGKDGKVYIPCKFKKIIFPSFYRNPKGNDFFFVSEEGTDFGMISSKAYFTMPLRAVFRGPDKRWYGLRDNGWCEIISPNESLPKNWNINEDPVKQLEGGYTLFDHKLYNSKGIVKLENVSSCNLTRIGDEDYYRLNNGNAVVALLNPSSNTLWNVVKESLWSNGLQYMMLINDKIYPVNFLDPDKKIFMLKHPEFDLYSLHVNSNEVIPFKLSDVRMYSFKKNGNNFYEIALECKRGLFEEDLKELVKALDRTGLDFVISVKSGIGKSLFAKSGEEISHNNVDRIFIKDNYLYASIDGKEINIESGFDRKLLEYDRIEEFGYRHKLVSKDGKVGIYRDNWGEVIPPVYDRVQWLGKHFKVLKNGLAGIYTRDGDKLSDPVFRSVSNEEDFFVKGEPTYFIGRSPSGDMVVISEDGRKSQNLGNYDRISNVAYGEAHIYKNGRVGIFNLRKLAVTVPCKFDDNIFWGIGLGDNRKVGVYISSPRGDQIEIWTVGGEKIASKFFPSGTSIYTKKRFLENHLQIDLYY